jgi:RNA-directed DNA polymerase
MMNGYGKSDSCVVSTKLLNKGIKTVVKMSAETMERRQLVKGNLPEQNTNRTQGRENVQSALKRIRDAAIKDKKQRFTALMHHIYSVDMLREAHFCLKREVSIGIDGVTWHAYRDNLEENLIFPNF